MSVFTILVVELEPGYISDQADFRQQIERNYPESLLLPDLKTLTPNDLRLILDQETGHKSIRFSNHILNRGPGDLEMLGQFNTATGMVLVNQIALGSNYFKAEIDTGVFYYHDAHNHWHWVGFAEYKIWSISPSGGMEKVLASSDKVGYCLEDVEKFSGNQSLLLGKDRPPPEKPRYTSCYWRRQGLSVGWIDIYRSHIPGQSIDITHLPDGLYALQSTVDPADLIWESNDTNNTATAYFVLDNNRIAVLKSLPAPIRPGTSPE